MKSVSFKQELIQIQNELHRYALKLTCSRNEADDLVQDTTLKALDNEEKYTSGTNMKGWLYTIMYNLFINNYRKVIREQSYVDQTEHLHLFTAVQSLESNNTESAYDLKEIRRIVNSLSREHKAAFSMHVSGFKYREIAEKLDMPIGTVKSRIYFTRQKLQSELKDFR